MPHDPSLRIRLSPRCNMQHDSVPYSAQLIYMPHDPSLRTHSRPLTKEFRLKIFGCPDLSVLLIDLLSDGDSVYSTENVLGILGTLLKTCFICTGTPVKFDRYFGSRNYCKSDHLRPWLHVFFLRISFIHAYDMTRLYVMTRKYVMKHPHSLTYCYIRQQITQSSLEWVMCCRSNVWHTNESCHSFVWHRNESRHSSYCVAYEWVTSLMCGIQMSHVTHVWRTNESRHSCVAYEWVTSLIIRMSHEWCGAYEWVTSYVM